MLYLAAMANTITHLAWGQPVCLLQDGLGPLLPLNTPGSQQGQRVVMRVDNVERAVAAVHCVEVADGGWQPPQLQTDDACRLNAAH